MLVDNELRDRTCVHPVEDLDRAFGARRRDAAQNRLCLVLAKTTRHDIADVVARAKPKAGLFLDDRQKLVKNPVHRVLIEALHGIHGRSQMLDLAWREVPQDLRGFLFTKKHHQDG